MRVQIVIRLNRVRYHLRAFAPPEFAFLVGVPIDGDGFGLFTVRAMTDCRNLSPNKKARPETNALRLPFL
jgi:hypothetical protein